MTYHIHACDDEPHIVLAVSLKFSKAGFRMTSDNNGQAAWESILRDPPQLVITDLQMPLLDGLGLIKQMRSHSDLKDIPVILLTAKGYELDDEEMRAEYGVQQVLCKPFSPRELVSIAKSLLAAAVAN